MTGQPAETAWNDYAYVVLGNTAVTPVIRELTLAPEAEALPYQPGQYVLLSDADGLLPPRSYSVASAPRPDGRLALLVTYVPGGATSTWVHERLRTGDSTTLTGPYGTFLTDPGREGPVLLLAAGSGLAPCRALAESLVAQSPSRPVTLFFSARTADDLIDDAVFRRWADERTGFRYLVALTRSSSASARPHIPDLLPERFSSLSGWEVFASGPPEFVVGCASAARALGADGSSIHTEEFFTDPEPWVDPPPRAAGPQVRR